MTKYRIECEWRQSGHYEVDAESEQQAKEWAEDCFGPCENLPKNGYMIDDTFKVTEVYEI